MNREPKIFAGRSNPQLTDAICQHLGVPLGNIEITNFMDGEIYIQVKENIRGNDVYLVQSTCPPVNDYIMELVLMLDAAKRASPGCITVVIPYFGYARQDRKVEGRVPISAKAVADIITAAGAQRVLTVDLHAGQIQGFFNIPVDNLFASAVFIDYIRNHGDEDLVVVAPDAGGVERARAYAKRLDADLGIIDKRRVAKNQAEVMHVIGDVRGQVAVIVDDMVDTGGTITRGAEALRESGALEVYACATHAVLTGPALECINRAPLDELVVTDTIPLNGKDKECPKLKVLSIAPLLAETIRRIHAGHSVSSLFD
ncbi:MAG: ribose-phosphate diphosphokinase [Nitrospinota bacterium]